MHDNWEELNKEITNCDLCYLNCERQLGNGNLLANVMIISYLPVLNKKKDFLELVLEGLNISMNDIYLTSFIKCISRDIGELNRNNCINYLRNEVILIKPKAILLLDEMMLHTIISPKYALEIARGKWISKKDIEYLTTYSLDDVIDVSDYKMDFWKDVKKLRKYIF